MAVELNRRDILKAQAAAIAATSSPCRDQMVEGAVPLLRHRLRRHGRRQGNRVVATHGDMQAEVNRGLNCVKGYFLSKIMYGGDRLTQPLLRKKNGVYAKDGEFTPVSWDRGLRHYGRQCQGDAEGKGADRGRHVRLRAVDDLGRLCRHQADAGRFPLQQPRSQCPPLHGLGRYGFMRTFGMDEPMGCYDDFEAPTPSCCGARTWRRCIRSCGPASPTAAEPSACEGRGALDLHPSQLDLADIPIVFKPGPTWRS
jgi:nitrate reductase NapA